MRSAAKAFGAGLVSLSFGMTGAPLPAQTAPLPSAPAAQNGVPNAPAPQTLPRLNTITPTAPAVPGSAAVPNAPAPQPDAATRENGGITPGTSLPSAPATQAAPAPQAPEPAGDDTNNPGPAAHIFNLGRINVNFVQVPFTVKDSKGHLVPGLTWRDVQVYENGLRQHIALFTVDPYPLSVALVIDQSVTFDTMQKINASLDSLQGAFTPYDEVSVFTYNNGVNQVTSFSGAQSARVTFALQRAKGAGREPNMAFAGPLANTTVKNNLPVDPNTNRGQAAGVLMQAPEREFHTLNDAILQAAVEVAKAGRGRRRVVYVISDGKEYGSQAKEKNVIRFLQTNGITVDATLVGDSSVPGLDFLDKFHLPLEMRDNVLPRYVNQTGGDDVAAFRPRAIEDSFAKITEEVRTQYTVGYYSHEPFIDGKFRTNEVRVLRPNLDVIARKGYYPRAESPMVGPANRTGSAQTPGDAATGPSQQ